MATDRQTHEKTWVEEDAQAFYGEVREMWDAMTVVHRVQIHEGRIFVVWKPDIFGAPQPLNSLRVVGIRATFSRGIEIEFLDARGRSVVIGQKPVPVLDLDLFMWCPYHNDVQWVPHPHAANRKVLRLAVVMKMRSHPDFWQASDTYVSDVKTFRTKFPQFAGQKF